VRVRVRCRTRRKEPAMLRFPLLLGMLLVVTGTMPAQAGPQRPRRAAKRPGQATPQVSPAEKERMRRALPGGQPAGQPPKQRTVQVAGRVLRADAGAAAGARVFVGWLTAGMEMQFKELA